MTPEEIKQRQSLGGVKGGKARVPKGFAKLTAEQRRAAAIRGNQARWGKRDE